MRLVVSCFPILIAASLAACAHTADEPAVAQSSRTAWSPLHDDADDATASLADGWTLPSGQNERLASIGERAGVVFTVTRPGAFDAILDARAFQKPRRLHVDVDGRAIAPPFPISVEAGPSIVLPIGTLGFGPHQIRFESIDGADLDASGRRVSIGVGRLTMERVGG